MPSKDKLLKKLFQKKLPRNFTKQELNSLMSQCGCLKGQGGRGSGIRFYHEATGRILAFDEPHPENELYPYQVKMTRQFLKEIGEYKED
ncbi:type II toxin-antitoxin system HicA family toxin [Oribacterium sp. NK2B42]|uniref:type II toxin-antitoxin system HicA family toxin n=1 Tax=Oribacterium sp. NK2B42 TaxID=689781 RepID=UPI000404093A|nr:type II toxin-antitoxin system HicA family toxin [Oribacterium sp. NK2B42]